VYRADRNYSASNTKRGGGVLTAVSKSFREVKRRYDLETADECVWAEIPAHDNYSLLIGNYYFPPDCDVNVIDYLNFLEHNLSIHLYRAITLGDFNVPKYGWINGTPLPNCHYCSKSKGNLIHATSCLLGLYQHNSSVPNSALLDLVLTNINDLRVSVSDFLWLLPTTTIPHFILILN
jgi:hypothetical protein